MRVQQLDRGVRFLTRGAVGRGSRSKANLRGFCCSVPNVLIHPIDTATPLGVKCRVSQSNGSQIVWFLSVTLRKYNFFYLGRTEYTTMLGLAL